MTRNQHIIGSCFHGWMLISSLITNSRAHWETWHYCRVDGSPIDVNFIVEENTRTYKTTLKIHFCNIFFASELQLKLTRFGKVCNSPNSWSLLFDVWFTLRNFVEKSIQICKFLSPKWPSSTWNFGQTLEKQSFRYSWVALVHRQIPCSGSINVHNTRTNKESKTFQRDLKFTEANKLASRCSIFVFFFYQTLLQLKRIKTLKNVSSYFF